MNKKLFVIAIIAIVMTTMPSCSPRVTGGGTSAAEIVHSYTGSVNDVNLEIASEPITYTIDVSTPEGRGKLNGITLPEAKSLALREAVMMTRSSKIVNPQYTQLTKGKQVLRITVYGFPAVYKNAVKSPYDLNTRQEIDINIK